MIFDLQALNARLRDLAPPQARDRAIFQDVLIQERGQAEVAREHGISQPRVSQILVEVAQWLERVLPQEFELTAAGRLALGSYLAEARLGSFLQQVMAGWEESKRDKVMLKEMKRGGVPCLEKTTVSQSGKVGFINSAIRLTLATARLAGVDTSGRTQRKLAEATAEKSLITRSENLRTAEITAASQPQEEEEVAPANEVSGDWLEQMKKQLIKETPLAPLSSLAPRENTLSGLERQQAARRRQFLAPLAAG